MITPAIMGWLFVIGLWGIVLATLLVYGILHYRISQGETGWRELYKLLGKIVFGWLRHIKLIIGVSLIVVGLLLIPMAIRYYTYELITGYRYLLIKQYTNVVSFTGGGTAVGYLTPDIIQEAMKRVVKVEWPVTFGVGFKNVLADANLLEFPVFTRFQALYLDWGLVLFSLTLIIIGLMLFAIHAVYANNQLLRECGDHTAKYWAAIYRLMGYEVSEEEERQWATFYKTGKR
ncbi:MAG: hypothetical protein QXK30_01645 [Candidatus Bathyarchaeia archaeon]